MVKMQKSNEIVFLLKINFTILKIYFPTQNRGNEKHNNEEIVASTKEYANFKMNGRRIEYKLLYFIKVFWHVSQFLVSLCLYLSGLLPLFSL